MQPYFLPSAHRSPRSNPAPLGPSAASNLPPRPDYTQFNIRRPSNTWLNSPNPGWMGKWGFEPTHLLHQRGRHDHSMLTHNPSHPMFQQVIKPPAPPAYSMVSPALDVASAVGATNEAPGS
ncbi:hypothetical protein B0H10DRAFT_1954425 [Mycena sp. CBHHK59/15]|nr:hypothetical protein B0H10DRAFT_1954425 [Mycena sp. CBHHK59/15]